MEIYSKSVFKDPEADQQYFKNWVKRLESQNQTCYEHLEIQTALGKTVVWGINSDRTDLKPLVIFPGFRTVSLFWDFDRGLDTLRTKYRIFLVDTNGQPCLSEGNTPDIKSEDYGWWAAEVLQKLKLEKTVVAGASFGGLVCLKLCLVAPEMVEKVVLLNPGCLQTFSTNFKNLYYNLLPLLFPTRKNIRMFLDKAVFFEQKHTLSEQAQELILDFQYLAINRFKDKAQKPYAMKPADLERIPNKIYLLLGEKDMLFPYRRSQEIATRHLKNLQKTYVLPETGHGIECSKKAMQLLAEIMAL